MQQKAASGNLSMLAEVNTDRAGNRTTGKER